VTQLTGKDRLTYGHASEALHPTKITLDLAAKEFAVAYQLLGGRTTILEAVKYYVTRHQNNAARFFGSSDDAGSIPKRGISFAIPSSDEILRLGTN
jgi:hypothetical protein